MVPRRCVNLGQSIYLTLSHQWFLWTASQNDKNFRFRRDLANFSFWLAGFIPQTLSRVGCCFKNSHLDKMKPTVNQVLLYETLQASSHPIYTRDNQSGPQQIFPFWLKTMFLRKSSHVPYSEVIVGRTARVWRNKRCHCSESNVHGFSKQFGSQFRILFLTNQT